MKLPISEKQSLILRWIVEHGPTKEYDLIKNRVVNAFVAYEALRVLEKKGYLRSIETGEVRRGPVRLYVPTLKGIRAYLLISELKGLIPPPHKEFRTSGWGIARNPHCLGKADIICMLMPFPDCFHEKCCIKKLLETLKKEVKSC